MDSPSNAEPTAALLPWRELVDTLRSTVLEVAHGRVSCPPRQVVGTAGGALFLSMLASAPELCVHKLVSVVAGNAARGLPTIQGRVQVLDGSDGRLLLTLDGATVTGRRTAAMSMLGIATLHREAPRRVLLIGTGTQARHHLQALRALHPDVAVDVLGRSPAAAERFCRIEAAGDAPVRPVDAVQASPADVVITCTTSPEPVYHAAADASRLLIAVGSFSPVQAEIAGRTVLGSALVVDDLDGARHEAGDLLRAGADWAQVRTLARAIQFGRATDRPLLFKTVGCAAWDLAAARVAVGRAALAA